MNAPDDLLYTTSHEWVRLKGDTAVVGITDFAQDQLSELTFVELPPVDDEVAAGDEVAVVESVKAASDVYSPLSGTILDVNHSLEEQPELINSDPFHQGWLFKLRLRDASEIDALMTPDAYRATLPGDR